MRRLDDGDTFASGVVAQHRCRATQGQCNRQTARCLRKAQHRFDLRREFVAQQQRPAAPERPTRLVAQGAL